MTVGSRRHRRVHRRFRRERSDRGYQRVGRDRPDRYRSVHHVVLCRVPVTRAVGRPRSSARYWRHNRWSYGQPSVVRLPRTLGRRFSSHHHAASIVAHATVTHGKRGIRTQPDATQSPAIRSRTPRARGGTGRRGGLKIRFPGTGVRVRVPPGPLDGRRKTPGGEPGAEREPGSSRSFTGSPRRTRG